jgi:hypothetical protein
MQTPTYTQSLTSADLKGKFRNITVTGLLLACAAGGFAQTQQASAADFTLAGNTASVEKQPVIAASSNAPNQAPSAAGLSKQIANPLSNLWLLQTQQNNTLLDMPLGEGTYVQSGIQFQPLVPIQVSPHWNLISRPVIQVFSSQPYPAVTSVDGNIKPTQTSIKRTTGFGDMIFATAISPDKSLVGNWLLAAGATFVFPTATEHVLGQGTWQAGPTVALGYTGGKWLAFVFPQQWWKIGGDGKKTNQTAVQYDFGWNFDNGWSLGTSPNLTINWEAPRDERVTFPLGLQVGKLLHAGPMPVKVDLQPMYYAVRPTHAYGTSVPYPKWGFQLQLTPVIPSLIHGHKAS